MCRWVFARLYVSLLTIVMLCVVFDVAVCAVAWFGC